MPAPSIRTWKFFGDVFSDSQCIDVTITFNGVVIHDGEIPADYSYYDYQNKWDEIMLPDIKHKLLCQTELPYTTTGLLPLVIKVNSDGVLNFASAICNYTSISNSMKEPLVDFGTSCDHRIDNKRNIRTNNEVVDVAPLGWSYHINKELEFQCDIFMDPRFSAWIPGHFASTLREQYRTRF